MNKLKTIQKESILNAQRELQKDPKNLENWRTLLEIYESCEHFGKISYCIEKCMDFCTEDKENSYLS